MLFRSNQPEPPLKEQSAKPQSDTRDLDQDAMELAFSRKQRQSRYVLRYGKVSITLLSGKNTGRFGVQRVQWEHANELEATDIERTLIDIRGYAEIKKYSIKSCVLLIPEALLLSARLSPPGAVCCLSSTRREATMPALDRSAYPRFPPKLSARDLAACSTPSAEEMARSRLVAKADRLQHDSDRAHLRSSLSQPVRDQPRQTL